MHSPKQVKENRMVNSGNASELEAELREILNLDDGIEIKLVRFSPSSIFFNGDIPPNLEGKKGLTVEICGVEYFFAFHDLYNRKGEKVEKIYNGE